MKTGERLHKRENFRRMIESLEKSWVSELKKCPVRKKGVPDEQSTRLPKEWMRQQVAEV